MKAPSAPAAAPALAAFTAPLSTLTEWNRQQVATAVGASYAMFRAFEAMRQCWMDIAGATLEMQTEMMACASHLVDSDAALEAASSVERLDAVPAFAAMFGIRPPKAGRR